MVTLLLAIIYVAFISLGLPDSLLGSAWPQMHLDLGAQLSMQGIISMIISCGTVISSFFSEKLIYKLGTGKVTAISTLMTAIALFGFSVSGNFYMLCIIAIPYGLGAGAIDAALNNYVAINFASKHMSWLHCFGELAQLWDLILWGQQCLLEKDGGEDIFQYQLYKLY